MSRVNGMEMMTINGLNKYIFMNISEELIEITPTMWLPKNRKIDETIRIEEDLCIYGDDAVDFIYNYSERLNVDISNFNLAPYFTKEYNFLGWIYLKLFPSKNEKVKTLTLGDLEKGIRYGRLDDEIISMGSGLQDLT